MKTILLVDDSPLQLRRTVNYSNLPEFRLVTATNGIEALETAITIVPDVIVSDLVMPEMSGLELIRQIRKNPQLCQIPIIVCSTKDRKIDKKWALKRGATAYLIKPFTRDDIRSLINNIII